MVQAPETVGLVRIPVWAGTRWIYGYFENSSELDNQRYLPAKDICEILAAAGLVNGCTGKRGIWAERRRQLAILADDEYRRGLGRIHKDILDERSRQELLLISDLGLYATTGWVS